jgi:glycosyltransferase involved in cell wall biosynthesis
VKRIVMLGTRFDTMGGISSVVNVYRDAGLFDRNPITYLPTHRDGRPWQKLAVLLSSLSRFVAMLAMGRVALVHIHVSSRASFWRKCLFFYPAHWFGIPTILHLHGSEFAVFYEQECSARARRFIGRTFDRASKVIALSARWQSWLASISTNSNIECVYNPVLMPPEPDAGLREPGVVLFLGRLGVRKGSYDLLEAVARVAEEIPHVHLVMGGDGEIEQVRHKAEELGLKDKVSLVGWVGRQQKEALLRRATIYALPSYNEGLPMSVLEAMAYGLPVVSTPIGGIPEAITNNVEGVLVEPGDVAGLAQAIRRLLQDPSLSRAMGSAARAKVSTHFDARTIAPRIERILRATRLDCP